MRKFLLFFIFLFVYSFSFLNRYSFVSLDLIQPTTKEVEIKGEVENPGVYTTKWDATVQDVISMAGGLTNDANTDSISLNEVIDENDMIVIPKESEKPLISINSASLEELQTLPGIGPSIASRIIEYRKDSSFKSLEDIKNVKGIGDKMFEKIKDLIVL